MNMSKFLICLFCASALIAQETPDTGIGYFGDGSGVYPDAKPPLKWSDTENIRWKIPLHNWTYCSPVPVKDRVYVTCHPSSAHPWPRVVCYSAKDGSELWQHDVNPLDAHPDVDEATRKQVREELSSLIKRFEEIYEICSVINPNSNLGEDHPTIAAVNEKLAAVNAK